MLFVAVVGRNSLAFGGKAHGRWLLDLLRVFFS